jgi:hypothetical protein
MTVFRNPKDLMDHLRQAAGEQQKEVIVTTQAWLGSSKNSPRDTGRFRSSWFAAEGAPSSDVVPEGADAPNTGAKSLSINLDSTYHLTNNLPYAAPIALGVNTPPSWGGKNQVKSAPATWFIEFRNTGIGQIADAAGQTIKRRFGL